MALAVALVSAAGARAQEEAPVPCGQPAPGKTVPTVGTLAFSPEDSNTDLDFKGRHHAGHVQIVLAVGASLVAAWLPFKVGYLDVDTWARTATTVVTLFLAVAAAAAGGSTTGPLAKGIVEKVKKRRKKKATPPKAAAAR